MGSGASTNTVRVVTIDQRAALSVTDAAGYLGISRRTIYRLITDGHLVRAKIGRRTVVTRASCDAYLAGRVEDGVQ